MIEIFDIFWSTDIELRVLLLAIPITLGYFFWLENKRKKEQQSYWKNLDDINRERNKNE
jgi:hypothetical protein